MRKRVFTPAFVPKGGKRIFNDNLRMVAEKDTPATVPKLGVAVIEKDNLKVGVQQMIMHIIIVFLNFYISQTPPKKNRNWLKKV